MYFNVGAITSLESISSGAHIHVIGVCGVAMAQLALLLSEKGYSVSGSDKEFYEPMGSKLRSSRVQIFEGYDAAHIPPHTALVLIGNAVSATNEEVRVVEQRKLKYTIFPKLMHEVLIGHRRSVVVSGTHGKSTTSALLAFLLEKLEFQPSYFIGGVAKNLPQSLVSGIGKVSVVEGDEYDSSFFAKVPKFNFYTPNILIVTSIEFDHADIYPDLAAINKQFDALVAGMKPTDIVIACIDSENMRARLKIWKGNSQGPRIVTYGVSNDADYVLKENRIDQGRQHVAAGSKAGLLQFQLRIPGTYNALNALSGLIVAQELGAPRAKIAAALSDFEGVKRRQELRVDGDITLIEDFAHHPTAVKETISGLRAWYPKRRIWGVFEPRSNTSRRKVFQDAYVRAFKEVDHAIFCRVQARSIDAGLELIDVDELSSLVGKTGVLSLALPDADAIFDHLQKEIKAGDVILVMSNGAFGNLPARLEELLQKR